VTTKGNRQRKRKTRAVNILATERRSRAIALRYEGKTFVEIGAILGVTGGRAHQLVTEAMDAANTLLVTDTAKLRQRQLDELAAIKGALWVGARRGEVGKVDRLDKIWSREAKLAGLDAPNKHEHSGPGGKPIDFREMRERVAGRIAALAAGVQSASNEGEKGDTPEAEPPEDDDDGGGG